MESNRKYKCISSCLIILIVICQIFYVVNLPKSTSNKQNIRPTGDELNNIKPSNAEVSTENQVVLIKGYEDDIINSGISALNAILNEHIDVKYETFQNLINIHNTLIIITHGTETGLTINDNFITWNSLATLLNISMASQVYLAVCCSDKIYGYNFRSKLSIVSLGSIVDAILIGYTLGALINTQYNESLNSNFNYEQVLSRYELITMQPELILPLYCMKISKIDSWFTLFGLPVFPIHLARIWQLKFSAEEVSDILSDTQGGANFLIKSLGKILNKYFKTGEMNPYLALLEFLLAANLIQFALMLQNSYEEHNHNGAWIAIVANLWPPIGVWVEARDPDGIMTSMAPMLPLDPAGFAPSLFTAFEIFYNNVPEIRSWFCVQDSIEPNAEIQNFPTEFQMEPCTTTEISFTLKNIGPISASYVIEAFGLDNIDYSLYPFDIVLEPDETVAINLQLHVPCNLQPQELDFGVRVLHEGEEKDSVNSKLIILDTTPPNFELEELTIYDDEPFKYPVDISKSEDVETILAKLYFQGTLISGTDLPEIIDMGDKIRYIFEFPQPLTLGDYKISISAFDSFGNVRTKQSTIHYLDDDYDGPKVFVTPFIQYITDAEDVFSFDVSISDVSDISSVSIVFDDMIIGDSAGSYSIISPKTLGYYTTYIKAIDNDVDRGDIDKAATLNSTSVYITDDDSSPPEININYYGSGTDGDPGYWDVYVVDPESGVAEIDVYIDDVLVGNENGQYYVPNDLGEHQIKVFAINADLDRELVDQEENTSTSTVLIIDDDEIPPIITSLSITDDIQKVWLTILTEDAETGDDRGIGEICIKIDENLFTFLAQSSGDTHIIDIMNLWIMEIGPHYVEVQVWDADDDRENDALPSELISGMFETTFEEMQEYVIWEISQFIEQLVNSQDNIWKNESLRTPMMNKMEELKTLVIDGYFIDAHDKLLHDIKPKLTGLKVDENGQAFDSGVFHNPWVVDLIPQEIFQTISDTILQDLTTLISKAIESQEFATQGRFLRSNEIFLGPLFILGLIILSLYYRFTPIFHRKKKL